MQVGRTSLAGVLLLTPTPHPDERGFFSRTFDSAAAAEAGIDPSRFVQDSISRSYRGVLRGLHLRSGQGEAKLVRCSYGAVFDVVVDLRTDSPSYRQWLSFELDGERQQSVYIPAGCAHGHQTRSDIADVSYRIDAEHDPAFDVTIAHDDPQLGITWPLPISVISGRDAAAQTLTELGL